MNAIAVIVVVLVIGAVLYGKKNKWFAGKSSTPNSSGSGSSGTGAGGPAEPLGFEPVRKPEDADPKPPGTV